MKTESLFDQVKAAGLPFDNHESDLYIPVNETSQKLINGYKFKSNVTQFTSQIDGKRWFDVPFAYEPFWPKR